MHGGDLADVASKLVVPLVFAAAFFAVAVLRFRRRYAMNRVWTLARKDLLETRRDRLSAIFIVIMPIAFTTFFGLMFGGGSDRLPLALHDADGGAQAKQLVAALERSDAVRVVPKSAAELRALDGRRPGRRRPAHPRRASRSPCRPGSRPS